MMSPERIAMMEKRMSELADLRLDGFDDSPAIPVIPVHLNAFGSRGIDQVRHLPVIKGQQALRFRALSRVFFHGGNFNGRDVDSERDEDDGKKKSRSIRRHAMTLTPALSRGERKTRRRRRITGCVVASRS